MGGKVIFSKRPRHLLEEVFDREEEIQQLKVLLDKYEWSMVLGPRTSGKTSLVLAVSNEERRKTVYVDLVRVKGFRDFVKRLYVSIPKTVLDKIREDLETLGIKAGPVSFSLRVKPTLAFETIMRSICNDTILILDEAQDLKQGVNHMVPVLHRLLNQCPRPTIVFTGSAIGLIKNLLEQGGEKPLAGRKPTEIVLKPWRREVAEEYLERGLQECRAGYTKDQINDVIETLGTMPGWLNIYGVNRCVKPHDLALDESLKEAMGIALEELRSVTEGRRWRKKALKLISTGSSWSDLLRETKVSTETLSNFLDRLERLYLITKEGRNYALQDPVYRRAVNSGL